MRSYRCEKAVTEKETTIQTIGYLKKTRWCRQHSFRQCKAASLLEIQWTLRGAHAPRSLPVIQAPIATVRNALTPPKSCANFLSSSSTRHQDIITAENTFGLIRGLRLTLIMPTQTCNRIWTCFVDFWHIKLPMFWPKRPIVRQPGDS